MDNVSRKPVQPGSPSWPSIKRELPHHVDALRGRHVRMSVSVPDLSDAPAGPASDFDPGACCHSTMREAGDTSVPARSAVPGRGATYLPATRLPGRVSVDGCRETGVPGLSSVLAAIRGRTYRRHRRFIHLIHLGVTGRRRHVLSRARQEALMSKVGSWPRITAPDGRGSGQSDAATSARSETGYARYHLFLPLPGPPPSTGAGTPRTAIA